MREFMSRTLRVFFLDCKGYYKRDRVGISMSVIVGGSRSWRCAFGGSGTGSLKAIGEFDDGKTGGLFS